jgi:hypothetical protein
MIGLVGLRILPASNKARPLTNILAGDPESPGLQEQEPFLSSLGGTKAPCCIPLHASLYPGSKKAAHVLLPAAFTGDNMVRQKLLSLLFLLTSFAHSKE